MFGSKVWKSALAVALLLGLGGCVDNGSSVFVTGVIPPEMEEGGGCTYDPETNVDLLGAQWDLAFGNSYYLVLAVSSQLRQRGSDRMADPNTVFLNRAEVELIDERTNAPFQFAGGLPNPFSVSTSAVIGAAADPMTPARGVVRFEAIPASYRDQIRDLGAPKVRIEAQLFGRTNGDIDIDTAVWSLPVDICTNCLRQCATGDEAALTCNPGQDFVSRVTPAVQDLYCRVCDPSLCM